MTSQQLFFWVKTGVAKTAISVSHNTSAFWHNQHLIHSILSAALPPDTLPDHARTLKLNSSFTRKRRDNISNIIVDAPTTLTH